MTTTSFVFGFGCGFLVAWGVAWLIAAIVWMHDKRESARWERGGP